MPDPNTRINNDNAPGAAPAGPPDLGAGALPGAKRVQEAAPEKVRILVKLITGGCTPGKFEDLVRQGLQKTPHSEERDPIIRAACREVFGLILYQEGALFEALHQKHWIKIRSLMEIEKEHTLPVLAALADVLEGSPGQAPVGNRLQREISAYLTKESAREVNYQGLEYLAYSTFNSIFAIRRRAHGPYAETYPSPRQQSIKQALATLTVLRAKYEIPAALVKQIEHLAQEAQDIINGKTGRK